MLQLQTKASNVYQRTAIETADPLQLIILCYDAAIQDLKQAKELHETRDMNGAYRKVRHARDIVTELMLGLDYERGRDIAVNLNRLYNFTLRKMIVINSRESASIFDNLVRILSVLREGWEGIKLGSSQTSVKSGLLPRNWRASA